MFPFQADLFKNIINNFQEHLAIQDNDRIVFSSKFGSGKTTFLKHYFGTDPTISSVKNAISYNTFHLYPVNYSASKNEDIIRYIKYDIICELLRNKIEVNDTQVSYLEAIPGYLSKNIDKIAAAIIYMIPKIGKDVVDIYEKINKLKEDFLKHADKENLENSEGNQLVAFMEQIEQAEGSIFESNALTKIIENILLREKGENEDACKENVLIIDDLDRLDPEHLFRILNVFAAHFDCPGKGKGKFGFDKIILVCDINNVRNIFHSKYGTDVDFVGYIDKFYSSEVFNFDCKKNIDKICETVVNTINSGNHFEKSYAQLIFGNSFIYSILSDMLQHDIISLRTLIKMYGRKLNDDAESYALPGGTNIYLNDDFIVALQIRAFCELLGGRHNFLKAVERLDNLSTYFSGIGFHCKRFIHLLSYDAYGKSSHQINFTFSWGNAEHQIIKNPGKTEAAESIVVINGEGTEYCFNQDDFVSLFKKSVHMLARINYLN